MKPTNDFRRRRKKRTARKAYWSNERREASPGSSPPITWDEGFDRYGDAKAFEIEQNKREGVVTGLVWSRVREAWVVHVAEPDRNQEVDR